jgi:hypothetical protein
VLFASNPSLSLSPRLDEIFLAMGVAETNHEELQNLISALVDVKIGRNDVATARHGDRRFAFSHRRYQETLFANFLAANPGRIPANDLLLRPEWRDYAVTLLQTQTIATTKGMLQAATELLTKKAEVQVQVPAKYMSELGAGFFNWEGEAFVSVLTILQEGLARRLQDVPEELSTAVSKILCPRWDSGDHLDRYMVIKLGGLLPQAQLAKYLRSALSDSRPQISAIAFKQCVFLRETSEEITKLICEKLARETLAADKTVAKLRLEALAQRLPSSVGALFVFRRCLRLRSILAKLCILSWVLLLPNLIAAQLARRIPTAGLLRERSDRLHLTFVYRGGNDWVIGLLAPLVMSLIYEFMVVSKKAKKIDADIIGQVFIKFCESTYFFPMLATYIFAAVLLIAVYKLRSEGHPLSLSLLFSVKRFKSLAADVLPLIYSLAGLGVLALLPFILGNVVKYVAGFLGYQMVVDSVYFNIGMPSVLALIISGGMLLTIYELRENRARNKRLIRLKAEFDDDCYIFLQAQKLSEAAIWLVTHPTFLASKKEDVRSASSIIRRLTDLNGRAGAEKYPLILAPVDPFQYMIVSNSVAVRALALEEIA